VLRSVLISSDTEVNGRLEELIHDAGHIGLLKTVEKYLEDYDLERFLRANGPQVVFLSTESLSQALETIKGIHQHLPGAQVVAVDRVADPAVLLDLMHAGVREFQAYPFDLANFTAMVQRLESLLERNPAQVNEGDTLLAFLPAKAGSGTSTIALNTAMALARMPDMKVLLSDMDLNSGMLGFMLKIESPATIYEAAEHSNRLDEHLWPQLVSKVGGIDLLAAGRLDPQSRVDPMQIRHILSFARRFYKALCVDLSGNMEKFSLEVMQEAKQVFLVCTPEIPALHLARKKIQLLQSLDLGDRICVLLNRSQKRPLITTEQIQQLLGVAVYQELPNDYRGVHNALTLGKAVDPNTELGKQFTRLAQRVTQRKPSTTGDAKKKKSIMDFFNVLPGYSLSAEKK
jgi:pilus assembly protein CpaE